MKALLLILFFLWPLCAKSPDIADSSHGNRSLEKGLDLPGVEGDSNHGTEGAAGQGQASTKKAFLKKDEPLKDSASAVPDTQAILTLHPITVEAPRTRIKAPGAVQLDAHRLKTISTMAEPDVLLSLQNMPGVTATSDFSSKLYVRGGASDQNLYLFDNAVLFSPCHQFGFFSPFLMEGIEKLDFYKGGYPVEFGNRLASTIQIQSRQGGLEKENSLVTGSSTKFGLFGIQAHLEGRQGPVRWLVGGRTSYIKTILALYRKLGIMDLELDYDLYDIQGNLAYDSDEKSGTKISFYQGRDELRLPFTSIAWGNRAYPINYHGVINEQLTQEATLSYSQFFQTMDLRDISQFSNEISKLNFKHGLGYRGFKHHKLQLGMDLNYYETVFETKDSSQTTVSDERSAFWLHSLYFGDKWTMGPHLITPGIRVNHLETLNEFSFEPRLFWDWHLLANHTLKTHIGYYRQFINGIIFPEFGDFNIFYYPAQKTTINTIKPASSLLWSAGYAISDIFGTLELDAGVYYKTMHNLYIYSLYTDQDASDNKSKRVYGDFLDRGEGYSAGWEVAVRRDKGKITGGFQFANAYTVLRESASRQVYFPPWHQGYHARLDCMVHWKGENAFKRSRRKDVYRDISLEVISHSGTPYTQAMGWVPSHAIGQSQGLPAEGPVSEFVNQTQVDWGWRNGATLPNYFSINLLLKTGKVNTFRAVLGFRNITFHKNIFMYYYDNEKNPPKRMEIPQLIFTPTFNIEYFL